jgi:hypothetical protein
MRKTNSQTDFKARRVIPTSVAKRLLDVGNGEWNSLVARRVIDVRVAPSGRQLTSVADIERALAQGQQQ